MLLFIATDVVLIAIGSVLYLMVRALPRVSEDSSDSHGILDRMAHSELPEKLDAAFEGFLVKFLRKLKIAMMRLDNMLSKRLRKINADETNAARAVADFGDFVNEQTN